jgi:large subunit ribosomal protein L6
VNISTSRIGRKPVAVPTGVEVKIKDEKLLVKGPKGNLSLDLHPFVHIAVENNEIKVQASNQNKKVITGASAKLYRSIAGTIRAKIYNLIRGVTHGYERKLMLVGVGYRAQAKGKILSLSLGYSHPTDFSVPEGVVVETPTQTEIVIKGASKELVGLVAAQIRRHRGPEPYKGKGIRYANEVIEIKETKKK